MSFLAMNCHLAIKFHSKNCNLPAPQPSAVGFGKYSKIINQKYLPDRQIHCLDCTYNTKQYNIKLIESAVIYRY